MKVISVWRAYAHLLVRGFKSIETRGWPAPRSVVGTRIAIAATKQIRPEERGAFADELFQRYYRETGLPGALERLECGCILGTVLLHSSDVMTEADLEDVTEEEQIFGWWEPGRYAWRCREPEVFSDPVPIRGAQGLWDWSPRWQSPGEGREARPTSGRRGLHVV